MINYDKQASTINILMDRIEKSLTVLNNVSLRHPSEYMDSLYDKGMNYCLHNLNELKTKIKDALNEYVDGFDHESFIINYADDISDAIQWLDEFDYVTTNEAKDDINFEEDFELNILDYRGDGA